MPKSREPGALLPPPGKCQGPRVGCQYPLPTGALPRNGPEQKSKSPYAAICLLDVLSVQSHAAARNEGSRCVPSTWPKNRSIRGVTAPSLWRCSRCVKFGVVIQRNEGAVPNPSSFFPRRTDYSTGLWQLIEAVRNAKPNAQPRSRPGFNPHF